MKISEIQYKKIKVNRLKNAYKLGAKKIKNASSESEFLYAKNNVVKTLVSVDTAYNLSFIRWSQNTTSKFWNRQKDYYEKNLNKLSKPKQKYIRAVLSSKYLSCIPNVLIFLHKNALILSDRRTQNERIKEQKLVAKYSNFMSSLLIEYNGEKLPLATLRTYMESDDRQVRKNAFNAFGLALKSNRETLEDVFEKLVKIRDNMAKKLKFNNYVDYAYINMNRVCYTKFDVENLRRLIVKHVVPEIANIKQLVGEKLGIKNLMLYDYTATYLNGECIPKVLGKDLIIKGYDMYFDIDEEMANLYRQMAGDGAIDFSARKNKWGGGYQTELKQYNQPFILANFSNNSGDVDVLTHEFGHAYASYKMSQNSCDKEIDLPFMEIAETHSMTMEFLCYKKVDEIFQENAEKYIFKHLLDSFTFLSYGSLVDAFQHEVYENPNITVGERNAIWNKLEKVYRPYLSSDGIEYFNEGTRWQYQMHVYESPFYYIDYVLAQITALNFYVLSTENYSLALDKYKKFISLGANYDYLTALKMVDMPSPFDEKTIVDMVNHVKGKLLEKFEKLYD